MPKANIHKYANPAAAWWSGSCRELGVDSTTSTPPENQVSLPSPGTCSIQEVHLGQLVFSALIQPSLLTCSDRQIHPHCPRTNEPIHLRCNPPDSAGSTSVALKPKQEAQGSGRCLALPSSPCSSVTSVASPGAPSSSARLHLLSPTGRKVTGGEGKNEGG